MKPEYSKEYETNPEDQPYIGADVMSTARRCASGHFMMQVDTLNMATALLEIHAAFANGSIKPRARLTEIDRALSKDRL